MVAAQILLWFAPLLWSVGVLWKPLGTLWWGLGLSWSCLVSVCSNEEQKWITGTFKADSVFFTQALLTRSERLKSKSTLISQGTYMETSGSVFLPRCPFPRLLVGTIHPTDGLGRTICFLYRRSPSNQHCLFATENGAWGPEQVLQPWKRASYLKIKDIIKFPFHRVNEEAFTWGRKEKCAFC